MNKDQERAWKSAEKAASAERKRQLDKARSDVVDLLKDARGEITVILAGTPTEYQEWRLTALQREIDRVLRELGQASSRIMAEAVGKAWEGGIGAIDVPMGAAGIRVLMPLLDSKQMMEIRAFTVDRISDISTVASARIKQQIGLSMIGAQSLQETIGNVAAHLAETSVSRASMIVRDSLSSAWSTASYDRALQSDGAGVRMKKTWRRSGKVFSRIAHDLADGTCIPIDQPFVINGSNIRHPHDPAAPLAEVINCGCICLYFPDGTYGTLPNKRPFTTDELALNPYKAEIQSGRSVAQLLRDLN
ncbi:hypothetical protein [Azonexus sp.]|jgi:hypothetical protein|uniref:hypothetical protein n=1 Tax=Azonexus sp. TaxID=1872668 RepID=UPI0028264A69|nr:hypothetical protein [Azonexus sp.]MDR1995115.1 hypothetical protein [Azonexus sp.]